MERVPKGYYPMKLVSPVQQTMDMAKKLVTKKNKTKGKVQKKRPVKKVGQKKKVQKNKSRPKKVQKKKSIKGGMKRRVAGSFVKRKDILS